MRPPSGTAKKNSTKDEEGEQFELKEKRPTTLMINAQRQHDDQFEEVQSARTLVDDISIDRYENQTKNNKKTTVPFPY